MKSETFWQGVVIQALGTLAAAMIIAIVAIFAGTKYSPAIRYFVIVGIEFVVQQAAFIALGYLAIRSNEEGANSRRIVTRWPRLKKHEKLINITLDSANVVLIFVLLPVNVILFRIMRDVIASLTGYST